MLREITILAVCAALSFSGGWAVNGWRKAKEIAEMKADYETKRGEAESQARTKEQSLQKTAEQVLRDKNAQVADITRRLNHAIAGLRTRPERSTAPSDVSTTTTACVGLSGAELARGDGEFLAGYAADAARLEAALKQCKTQYEFLRSLLE
jgi:hypothetical protein